MSRARALLAAVLLAAAACGGTGGVRVLAPEELPEDVYAPPSPTPTAAAPRRIAVYFVRSARLESVSRQAPGSAQPGEFAMRTLLEGPSAGEQAAGFVTAVPDGAELLGVDISGETAEVNLTKEFELSAEQRVLLLRLGQVVYTLTGLERVEQVRFLIDGEPVSVVAQDGATHEVVDRGDYSRLLVGPAPSPGPTPGEGG